MTISGHVPVPAPRPAPGPRPLPGPPAVGTGTATWPAWGRTARVVLTAGDHPELLDDARDLVSGVLSAVDRVAGRDRPDAEVHRLLRAGGRTITVSPLLAELVATALAAARRSGGAVDPTVGAAMNRIGDHHDRSVLPVCAQASPVSRGEVRGRPAPGWHVVRLEGRRLGVPAGVSLDLGATARAFAADRAAALVADRLGVGVLVSVGGHVATAGRAPAGGWRIRVADGPGDPACTIVLPAGAAVATSGTLHRVWRHGEAFLHHIVDPRTGTSAATPWRTATAVGVSCVEANTLTTGALVRGDAAARWLNGLGAPARLVTTDGAVVTVGAWPAISP
jgi:thiamine biosynthesis lipoprotein